MINIIQNIKKGWNNISNTVYNVTLFGFMGAFGALSIYNTKDISDLKRDQKEMINLSIETNKNIESLANSVESLANIGQEEPKLQDEQEVTKLISILIKDKDHSLLVSRDKDMSSNANIIIGISAVAFLAIGVIGSWFLNR